MADEPLSAAERSRLVSDEVNALRRSSTKDRFIARLVSFLNRMMYRDVEVHWAAPIAADAPLLTTSNHFGGASDGLVLLDVFPRRPGIVARDVIWKIPIARSLMNWIGGIPVHKPDDSAETSAGSRNDQMFGSCYEALRQGGHILIFPEGVTRNEPSIAPVKTGAARIALGARAAGARGVIIQPIGIHYEDKAALRSRVFVNGGVPIDLDALVADQGHEVDADDREAVRRLTDVVETALRRAAPDYENWDEARALTTGAEISLRTFLDDPTAGVPIGLRDRLANTLADRPEADRERIRAAVADYRDDLDGAGLTDADLFGPAGGHPARSVGIAVLLGMLLFPFAVAGAIINLVPYLCVKLVGLLRVAPSVMSSLKPVVAILAFGGAWALVIWRAGRTFGVDGAAAAFVLMPVYLAAAILFIERAGALWRMLVHWRRSKRARGLQEHLERGRAQVVEAVLAA